MKTFKLSLCTAVALSAMVVGAKADMLSDLKASTHNLDAPMAGALTGNNAFFDANDNIHSIIVGPAADVPAAAPTTVLAFSGYVRAEVRGGYDAYINGAFGTGYTNAKVNNAGNYVSFYPLDVMARAKLKVLASTDTDMGQFGAAIEMRAADFEGGSNPWASTTSAAGGQQGYATYNAGQSLFTTDGFYGWWKTTSGITLSGGNGSAVQKGSLAMSTWAIDPTRNPWLVTGNFVGTSYGAVGTDPAKMPWANTSNAAPVQLVASDKIGGLTVAVGIEDAGNRLNTAAQVGNGSGALGVTGKVAYNAGMLNIDVQGGTWGGAGYSTANQSAWLVSSGVGIDLSPIKISAAIGTGNIGDYGASSGANGMGLNTGWTFASAMADFAVTPTLTAEAGVWADLDSYTAAPSTTVAGDANGGATQFHGGLVWSPKKYFTTALEGEYLNGGNSGGSYVTDVTVIWKF